jgi:hypothetical protein
MNAEIFREINIGTAELPHQPPKRQISHVLHRRQSQNWLRTVEQPLKLSAKTHG